MLRKRLTYSFKSLPLLCWLLFGSIAAVTGKDRVSDIRPGNQPAFFDVRHYGAKGDGTALDSKAINAAIGAAAAAGGGTVYFPAGGYLSGSIRL